jgi:hypothetical protein
VTDAAVELSRTLASRSDDVGLRYRRSLMSDHTWIELAGTDDGEVLRYRSPLLRQAVLVHAWRELDGMRPKILEWLRKLAAHSDVEVRARAATSAGILAAGDFQHALHRYLLPWASSKAAAERHSAALALGFVGALAPYRERVWSLLRQWAAEVRFGNRPRLAATVAVAMGGSLGTADPARAVRLLHGLVEDGDWDLLEYVAVSALQLVEEGAAEPVVKAFLEWTEPKDDSPTVVKTLTMFVFALREATLDGVDDEAGWPALLAGAARHYDELPELWGRALGCDPVRDLALDALREWLRIADRDPGAYPIVLDVIAGITDRSETDLERLEHHLEVWAEDADDPSEAAARVYDALADVAEETG